MTPTSARLLLWTPRILGFALCVFLGLFALDAFEPGKPLTQGLLPFVIHLAPSFLVLAVVALSWRREWIGALAFLALAAGYAVMVRFRLDWILAISGPLVLVGLLFLWSWRNHQELHAREAH